MANQQINIMRKWQVPVNSVDIWFIQNHVCPKRLLWIWYVNCLFQAFPPYPAFKTLLQLPGVLAWTTSSRKSVPFDGTQIEIGTAQQRGPEHGAGMLKSLECPIRSRRTTCLYIACLGPGCVFWFSSRQGHIHSPCSILVDCHIFLQYLGGCLCPGWSFGWSTWGMESWAKDDISGLAETGERKERGTSEAAGGRKHWEGWSILNPAGTRTYISGKESIWIFVWTQ